MSQSDIHPVINPIYWTTEELISYGHDTIHELAINAAGTVNSYQVVLGRCLLAVERTKLYEAFGCSEAVHYGTQVLGLTPKQARAMRSSQTELDALSKSQVEARKDIWADHCRREPLLQEARELPKPWD